MENRDLVLPFHFNPACHHADAAGLQEVRLSYHEPVLVRNQRQADAFKELGPTARGARRGETWLDEQGRLEGSDPFVEHCACYEVDLAGIPGNSCINQEPIFRQWLYLFNVVIALEWNPSGSSFQQLRLAMQKASNFLYDVTNGYMAIGQVVIGGPDLMDAADIQIMASNRLHPRAWGDALNQSFKFKPIRVGRGVWQKNQGFLATWDSPEGYRALVHEWGHYAYGLADKYLQRIRLTREDLLSTRWQRGDAQEGHVDTETDVEIAAPMIALSVETLMASNQISEFAPFGETFERIHQNYPHVSSDNRLLEGPDELPLPLPVFLEMTADGSKQLAIDLSKAEEIRLPVAGRLPSLPASSDDRAGDDLAQESHWLYVLKAPRASDGLPERVIAQGKIGRQEREQGARLLGATAGDHVVVVSQVGEEIKVRRGTLNGTPPDVQDWQDVTPAVLDPNTPFFVDVVPQPLFQGEAEFFPMQAEVRVRVEAPQQPDVVRIYPSGQMSAHAGGVVVDWNAAIGWSSAARVPHLDGHVLLRWQGDQGQPDPLFICSYSQGGGPNTSGGGFPPHSLPITAGSAEGNAMVFFRVNSSLPKTSQSPNGDRGVRIVTTMMTIGQQRLASEAEARSAEARSYIFSLASNQPLDPYPATLVLYYDRDAPQPDGDLLIYRWDGKKWRRLTTLVRADLPYVAIPLMQKVGGEMAPGLLGTQPPHVDRYRIFWTPVQH